MTWVYFTLLAATMQAVRTAGQKQLAGVLSTLSSASVRYLFALPFAFIYLYGVVEYTEVSIPEFNSQFFYFAFGASIAQIIGTASLVAAFSYRNFAVSTSLAKTEAIQVAVVGSLLFAEPLSFYGWFSVVIGVVGVLMLSKVKFTFENIIGNKGVLFGLGSGLGLAFATLMIREASLSLETNRFLSAAITLVVMLTIQSLLSTIMLVKQDKSQFALMAKHWRLALFVGMTSLLGSIGWFTAASFQTAAYVKALGQVEFFITLVLTYRLFKEKITILEYIGMLFILLSVFVLLLLA